jgi:hypothetical protein
MLGRRKEGIGKGWVGGKSSIGKDWLGGKKSIE